MLEEIFESRNKFNGGFTKFYEDLEYQLSLIDEKARELLIYWQPNKDWDTADKLKVLYGYTTLP